MQSTSSGLNCTSLQRLLENGVDKGIFACAVVPAASTNPDAISSSSSSSPTPSPTASNSVRPSPIPASTSSHLSKGAIAGIVIGAVIALVAATTFYWFCIGRQHTSAGRGNPDKHELPLGGHNEKTELPSQPNHVSELSGDRKHTLQRDQNKEAVGVAYRAGNSAQQATISNPGELSGRDEGRWELEGDTGAAELTEGSTIPEGMSLRRKPVPSGQR